MQEFILWGIAKDTDFEQILIAQIQGEKITDRKVAENLKKLLEEKYQARAVRIQEINFTDGFNANFANSIN